MSTTVGMSDDDGSRPNLLLNNSNNTGSRLEGGGIARDDAPLDSRQTQVATASERDAAARSVRKPV